MSIDPSPNSLGNRGRWIATYCLGALAVLCIGSIASCKLGSGLDPFVPTMAGFIGLDLVALIGLGVWILRPPLPGAVTFLGRWAGKVLLFLGLGLAVFIFLFATCMGMLATYI